MGRAQGKRSRTGTNPVSSKSVPQWVRGPARRLTIAKRRHVTFWVISHNLEILNSPGRITEVDVERPAVLCIIRIIIVYLYCVLIQNIQQPVSSGDRGVIVKRRPSSHRYMTKYGVANCDQPVLLLGPARASPSMGLGVDVPAQSRLGLL